MLTTIIFLLVLAVLIFVHELGHFLFARMNGIRVDEFKIGFGPRLISWGKGETKYGLNLIPFGGYVKIHGENPDDESINGPDKDRSFVHKSRPKQIAVLAAGVLFNFLFAWLLYVGIFSNGVTASKTGFEKYSEHFNNPRIMVTSISPDSPAKRAGLEMGDILLSINGKNGQTIENIQSTINGSGGAPLELSYSRGQTAPVTTQITPVKGIVENKYAIGIAMDDVVDIRLPFFTAIYEGAHYTGIMIKDTAVGLSTFISNIFKGKADFSDVSGPIGIGRIVGSAAELGFTYLLLITALISINLGVINLIPFPALDGGRILFVLIEGIIRRPIAPKYSNAVNMVGFVLLMLLMVVVTYKDIVKLFV